jgi:hypothetical protein
VELETWRGAGVTRIVCARRQHDGKTVIKQEKLPDGRLKLILEDEATGEFADVVTEAPAAADACSPAPLDRANREPLTPPHLPSG